MKNPLFSFFSLEVSSVQFRFWFVFASRQVASLTSGVKNEDCKTGQRVTDLFLRRACSIHMSSRDLSHTLCAAVSARLSHPQIERVSVYNYVCMCERVRGVCVCVCLCECACACVSKSSRTAHSRHKGGGGGGEGGRLMFGPAAGSCSALLFPSDPA